MDHPSIFLKQNYLGPNKIGSNQFAKSIDISNSSASEFLNGKSKVTPLLSKKLSLVYGLKAEDWMYLQCRYDIEVELNKDSTKEVLKALKKLCITMNDNTEDSITINNSDIDDNYIKFTLFELFDCLNKDGLNISINELRQKIENLETITVETK